MEHYVIVTLPPKTTQYDSKYDNDPDRLITSSKLLRNDHVMTQPLRNHYVIVT